MYYTRYCIRDGLALRSFVGKFSINCLFRSLCSRYQVAVVMYVLLIISDNGSLSVSRGLDTLHVALVVLAGYHYAVMDFGRYSSLLGPYWYVAFSESRS